MALDGTVALITGGARRVGGAIAWELANAGCDVAIHYHTSGDEARSLAARITDMGRDAVTIAGDLNDPDSWLQVVRQAVEALGRLDILVNNAAVFSDGDTDSVGKFDPNHWEAMLRVNLIAPMALCHHASPYLQAHGNGSIVNLCDVHAERAWPNHLAYSASKAALASLTKGLARALAPHVRVNGVAPGIAAFPEHYDAARRRRLTQQVPLQREGSPEEVAHLVRFLVEHGNYLTGEIVAIDGGRSLV